MRVHNKQKRFFQTFADGTGPDQSAHLHNKEKRVYLVKCVCMPCITKTCLFKDIENFTT